MKITGLETKVAAIDGEDEGSLPTYRKVIQLVIANSKARTADDARRVARIVPKVKTGDEAELTAEEFTVLKGLVETNQANLSAYVQGCLLEKIDPSKS